MSRIITITSGKGGVGKTTIALNLALYLSSQGYRICLFDADLGLANINILLGLHPEHTLKDVLLGGLGIEEIIIRDVEGVDILPGSSGVEELTNLPLGKLEELSQTLSGLEKYEYLLFDTSAGISQDVISFCLSSPEVVVIITPEPTSLTDAYSLVKVLKQKQYDGSLAVVVNNCKDFTMAKSAYTKFKAAINKYLAIDIRPLGVVLQDPKVVEAVKEQRPFLLTSPNAKASLCIKKIGQKLIEGPPDELELPKMPSFWKRCLEFFQNPLEVPGKREGREPEKGGAAEVGRREYVAPPQPQQEIPAKEAPGTGKKEEAVSETMEGPIANHFLLKQLIEGISSVSEELRLLRETMGMGVGLRAGVKGNLAVGGARERPRIRLDLEAFVNKRQGGGQGSKR